MTFDDSHHHHDRINNEEGEGEKEEAGTNLGSDGSTANGRDGRRLLRDFGRRQPRRRDRKERNPFNDEDSAWDTIQIATIDRG